MIPKRKHPVVETTEDDDENLFRRAYAAAFRAAKRGECLFQQPGDRRSAVGDLNGRRVLVSGSDHDVYPAKRGPGTIGDLANRGRLGQVKLGQPQPVAMLGL